MRKLLVLIFALLLAACTPDPNRDFIQGTWLGTEAGGVASGQLFVQWQFSRGGFVVQQEIRAGELMFSQGSYRIVESEQNLLMVELYNISGDVFTYNNLPVTYKIEIDRERGIIRINDKVFERGS